MRAELSGLSAIINVRNRTRTMSDQFLDKHSMIPYAYGPADEETVHGRSGVLAMFFRLAMPGGDYVWA